MDRFYKRKKQSSTPVSTAGGGMDRYYKKQYYNSLDTSGVDDNYINTFVSDANSFLSGAGNFSIDYDSAHRSLSDLGSRYDTLQAYFYKNRKNFDDETYGNLTSALGEFGSNFDSINKFYSQFDSADSYNSWYENYKIINSEEATLGWQKYLSDQGNAKSEKPSALEESIIRGFTTASDNPFNTAFNNVVYDYRNDESYRKPKDDWTEEQQKMFGYLYMSSPEKAYQYAIETNNSNNKETEAKALEKIVKSATSNGWAGAGHTLGAIATAPFGLADTLNDLAMVAAGRPITSDGFVSPFEYSQAVTSGISTHLNEAGGVLNEDIPLIGGKGLGDVYGLGTSIAQSMASAYTLGSAGTLISYFGQGAASGIDDAISRGASEGQAVLYGLSLGVFEGVAEMVGIDNLFKLGSASTLKGLIKNILKQAGAEGAEEGLTAIFSNIADAFIMQDKSNFNAMLNEYIANGMSESDAKWKVFWDSIEGIAFDTVAGAISGGVSGSVHTTVQNIASNIDAKNIYGDNVQDLVTESLEIDPGNAHAQ
ncbi:MAG: hypothetical protein IKW46_08060, partial [Bacteroidaceae bacterium]|nr:hypothetical protein [Bacteroidaceae bacterium]